MKRYMLFAGEDYYPERGADDWIYSDDNIQGIKNFIIECQEKGLHDWYQIFDCKLEKIVLNKSRRKEK